MKSIKNIFLLVVIAIFFAPKISNAQDSSLGNWLIYIGNKKIDEKWNIHNEVQYRNYNAAGDLEQLLLRTGLGYNVTNNSNILLGYGYILSENYIGDTDDKVTVNEHRIFQQFTPKARANGNATIPAVIPPKASPLMLENKFFIDYF